MIRAAANLQKVGGPLREGLGHQRVDVVDAPDGGDGEVSQVRAHDQRLRLGIGDASDAQRALHGRHIPLKLGAERGVFDVVNGPVVPLLGVVDGHAAASRAQMGMIIRPKEQVEHAVVL